MLGQGRLLELIQDPRIIDAANDPDLRARLKKIRFERGADLCAAETAMKYIATIGLEVHVQLKTRSKMFLRVPGRIWSGAEHAYVPGLPWFAGRIANDESRGPAGDRC